MRFHKFAALAALLLTAPTFGQSTRPAPALPPDADAAPKALADSPRHGESADIQVPGGPTLRSYVVYPERPDRAPVVIVIHEIFGMSDWVRGVADALAAQGFVAVAPDLLSGMGPNGGGTESFPEGGVRQAIRTLTPAMQEARLDAVRAWAAKLPSTTNHVGVIGFCWGGTASFNYATHAGAQKAADGGDLLAAVVCYGTAPQDKAKLQSITVPVLGFYGGDDARVTSTVDPTKAAMKAAGKSYDPHVYPGAGHGFLRQQDGRDGANRKAADAAWPLTVAFLREHLEAK